MGSCIGTTLALSGILAIGRLLGQGGTQALIGSFGASAVLLFAAPSASLSQPRNLLMGHTLSALVGVTVANLLPSQPEIAATMAVALAIVAMQCTRSLHPPGGATALIAVIGPDAIVDLGYTYVLWPVLTGAIVMLAVARMMAVVGLASAYPAPVTDCAPT